MTWPQVVLYSVLVIVGVPCAVAVVFAFFGMIANDDPRWWR